MDNETKKPQNDYAIVLRCGAPAPLVANGAGFVGCDHTPGHEGDHQVTIRWGR